MASSTSSLASTLSSISSPLKSPLYPHQKPPTITFSHPLTTPLKTPKVAIGNQRQRCVFVKAQTFDFSSSFFEGDDEPPTTPGSGITAIEDKEEPQCPPGLRHYETMAVLRPDMSEDERLTLTQRYEELLVAGGGMYVEVFNRGVIPLAYSIRKKNKAGETNSYLDGIYLLFTYFTKPESMRVLEETLQTDDDVIRSMSFKVRKRKH